MSNEMIEQRVFRIGRIMHGRDTMSFDDAMNDRNFKLACKLVELAIAEEREASGWKPMWTAPKDGAFVDLWLRGHRVTDCYWHKGDWMSLGDEGYSSFESRGMHNDPSHWMLSPNGPKDEASE